MNKISIKVQDGCSQNCSYCIVRELRGKSQSYSYQDICKDIDFFINELDCKTFDLCGVNTLEYHHVSIGDFIDLCKSLSNKYAGIDFIIDNINPFDKNKVYRLIDLVKETCNISKELFISIQSASNNLLKAMHRPYTKESLYDIFNYAKINNIIIKTEIIVGFPGETESDFEETYDFLKFFGVNFTAHVYSNRPGTEAAEKYTDIIPEEVILSRINKYRKLQKDIECQQN